MHFGKYFYKDCVEINSTASSKREVLKEIAKLANRSPEMKNIDEKAIYKGLLHREKKGSTGFFKNIAIPHCTISDLNDFIIGVLINKEGIDFDALDGSKTKIFTFIIAPEGQQKRYLRILSNISYYLKQEENIKRLLSCQTSEDVRDSFLRHTATKSPLNTKHNYALFHVFIQNEEYFQELIDVFAEIEECHICVIDGNNASRYLYRQPLFAGFWDSEENNFNRLIVAAVRQNQTEEAMCRINTYIDKAGENPGILLTVQEIKHLAGSLNI